MVPSDELTDKADGVLPDYGLIAPLSLPRDGKIPDAGVCGREEYEKYFRLLREDQELAQWSLSCLSVQRRVLSDLDATDLSAEDRCHIMAGCLMVMHCTLEKWLGLSTGTVTR
jgi:hypothetical protein